MKVKGNAVTAKPRVCDMQPGQLAVIEDLTSTTSGQYVFRTNAQLVSLNDPRVYWSNPENCPLTIRVIPSGQEVTFITE